MIYYIVDSRTHTLGQSAGLDVLDGCHVSEETQPDVRCLIHKAEVVACLTAPKRLPATGTEPTSITPGCHCGP